MGKRYILFGLILLVFAACTQQPTNNTMNLSVLESDIITIDTAEPTTPDQPLYDEPILDTKPEEETEPVQETKPAEIEIPEEYQDIAIRKYATEGDLISLNPQAVDYDGDEITYTFTGEFAGSGDWQTNEGDAGFYPVTITASDGKDTTSEKVLVIVQPSNKAPVLDCPEELMLKEGERLTIDCTAEDPEGDNVILEYSGWVSSRTKQTDYKSAGTHFVTVKASDGKMATEAKIKVIVEDVNRAPVIRNLQDITVIEGEEVKLMPEVSDEDDDDVTVTYSEPLDRKGEWMTEMGDKGVYYVTVSADDGKSVTERKVRVTVNPKNQPPVLNPIDDITVDEGQTIRLPIAATDPDGDDITVTISGWMTTDEYTTNYNDAGEHRVTVAVSDGQLETVRTITVTVNDKNRPPVFRVPV